MIIKLFRDKLTIKNNGETVILFVKYDRLLALKGSTYYESVPGDVHDKLNTEQVICKLIRLFSFNLEIMDEMLGKHIDKLEVFIHKNIPGWKFNTFDKTYTDSESKELKIYRNKDKINKASTMFLLSNYFKYFENQYAIGYKELYISSICQYHNREKSLVNALLAVKVDYDFPIEEATNINLVKFLEKYSKDIWR